MNSLANVPLGVLDPQGPIAAAERTILANATVIMLAVVVPVIVAVCVLAWWFRKGNARAKRRPDWAYSGAVEVTVWSIPVLVIAFLGGIAWLGSHDLHPARPISDAGGAGEPFEVQVVSLDWKWLFLYPHTGVASINRLVVPAGVPLRLRLTSATVMNSFLVPQLGSQIYAMAGMTTTLNLRADRPGSYSGLSAQFSGDGFSDMRFQVVAMGRADFDRWQTATRDAPDAPPLATLLRPSIADAPQVFKRAPVDLFDTIVHTSAPAGH